MSEVVELSVASGMATIALNGPHVMNAMDGDSWKNESPSSGAFDTH